MTRKEIDPGISDDSSPTGTPYDPAEMRGPQSNVSKLAHRTADVAGKSSDNEFNEQRAPDSHAVPTARTQRKVAARHADRRQVLDMTPLEAIGSTFDELRDTIADVRQKSATALVDVLRAMDLADKIEEIIQPIEERLLDVAWQSQTIPCQSPSDLRIKAEILKFIASDEPDDIQSALTQSLCNDIISRTSRRPEGS